MEEPQRPQRATHARDWAQCGGPKIYQRILHAAKRIHSHQRGLATNCGVMRKRGMNTLTYRHMETAELAHKFVSVVWLDARRKFRRETVDGGASA